MWGSVSAGDRHGVGIRALGKGGHQGTRQGVGIRQLGKAIRMGNDVTDPEIGWQHRLNLNKVPQYKCKKKMDGKKSLSRDG